MAFCPECGTPHETGQRFCANCGAQLGGVITRTGPPRSVIPSRAPASGLSIASFVVGLLALLGAPGAFSIFFAPMVVGSLAIFMGLFAHRTAQRHGMLGDGFATAGIVLGIIATVISALFLISLHPWSL